jgi:hypothetical protein
MEAINYLMSIGGSFVIAAFISVGIAFVLEKPSW